MKPALGIFVFALLATSNPAHAAHVKGLTCQYGGKMSSACTAILARAADTLKRNPHTRVIMLGGDDETGEFLTGLGIDAARISEKPSADGTLSLVIVSGRKLKCDSRDDSCAPGCP
jgi:hypothetical protein